MIRSAITWFFCLWLVLPTYAQFSDIADDPESKPYLSTFQTPEFLLDSTDQWVDKTMRNLTEEQRIAQLFMVAAYSNRDEDHIKQINKLITQYHIGGLIFFQGGPVRQAKLTNAYQEKSEVPLMIAMDAEWGLSMRLDSTMEFPRQMALGAIADPSEVYEMGRVLAMQCKRLGVHVNFAPVVDINNNPNNPVINSRSFGEDKLRVAQMGMAYMKGMQDEHVVACAKHFPGHGDTDKDSHKALPVINHDSTRLHDIELYPFRELINGGLASVMVAHLQVPALEPAENTATTLSPNVVTELLQDDLKFKGLIFTDALNMKGVSQFYKPGEVDVKALLAGNDVLLFAEDVPQAIKKIKESIAEGLITQEEVDRRCRKILAAKKWVGLDKYEPIVLDNLANDLSEKEAEMVNRNLVKKSLTLLKNNKQVIPIRNLDSLKIASIAIGADSVNTFQSGLSRYAQVDHFQVSKKPQLKNLIEINDKVADYDLLIVSLHGTSQYPSRKFGVTNEAVDFLTLLAEKKPTIFSYFGNPYGLARFTGVNRLEALAMGYHDNEWYQDYMAQALFGAIPFEGKLPVSVGETFPVGTGLAEEAIGRFEYSLPEDLGINSSDLAQIDSIAWEGIRQGAYPGCQILVARKGKVLYSKNFGYHTYDKKIPVTDESIYDLASITKVAATTFSLMKLMDEGKVSLDNYLCDYLPEWVDTATYQYSEIKLRDMLAHQAGLVPWIPFYKRTLANGYPMYNYYSLVKSETYPYKVTESLYMHKDYPAQIISEILNTPLRDNRDYKYSDLGYYFLKMIVEKETGQTLDQYVLQEFYRPMGLTTTGFYPRERAPLDQIVPTENDKTFRRQLIHGDVHDPGAAMMGGVGGHAGLFSNANDLAKIMQCFMQFGHYGNEQYLSRVAVKEFTKCQFCEDDNRRGAGFDKPVRDGGGGPTCHCISYESFGHTGFTGTMAWADPTEEVVYIFLSNRVYPDASNYKLIQLNTRTRIQEVIYDAIEASKSRVEG
ncbi:serine hydrolase [bacterium SCSIO 12741]|nr:serine hydrolase [bacterium SCSIO 12741]